MNRTAPPMLIASLLIAVPALAQETPPWITDLSATIGGIGTDKSGRDFSKIEEYQDLRSGILTNILGRGRDDRNWFDFEGENFGRDDMYFALRGGQYDTFKYGLYSNWLPHNLLYGGLTPFLGSGSALLTPTTPFPQPDPATFNPLRLGIERKDTGGYFEWQATTPWYVRIEGNQVTSEGTRPGSGALGTSPGNGFMDLAFPIDYKTSNASAEFGYSTSRMHFAVNYLYSHFDNGNTSFQWTNPFFGNNADTTYLANDNNYQRLGANGVIRGLPLSSTFAARYTWSKTTNDMPTPLLALTTAGSSGTGMYVPTLPNVAQFNGETVNQTLSLSLNSTPIRNVDTKIYYNYYSLDNNSTQVVFAGGTAVDCDGPCNSLLYDYRKNNAGLEATWRINRANRLAGGWDYLDTNQNRVDFNDIRYNKLWIEWKNTSFDDLSTRLKYQYTERRSDFLLADAGTGPNDPNYINRFIARFDDSDLNQSYVKFTADWSPMDRLDTSVEGTWKHNDYTNTVLGRTKDERREIFATVSYGDPKTVRVTLMGDYEWVKYDSYHRNISDSAASGAFDPNTPATSSNYNWAATNHDDNWLVGVGLDWQATDRLLFKASLQHFQSDGTSDVDSQQNFGNPLPIPAFDDWKQTAINLKGIYTFNRNWSLTAGYAYNRTRYSDIAYDGYQYTIPYPGVTTNPGQSYLNGYRAFTNASANIFYLLTTYHF